MFIINNHSFGLFFAVFITVFHTVLTDFATKLQHFFDMTKYFLLFFLFYTHYFLRKEFCTINLFYFSHIHHLIVLRDVRFQGCMVYGVWCMFFFTQRDVEIDEGEFVLRYLRQTCQHLRRKDLHSAKRQMFSIRAFLFTGFDIRPPA